jgi:hypothetical protein
MSRQKVVEIKCDRCSRIEYKKASSNGELKSVSLAANLKGTQDDVSIAFEDLCSPCTKTVANHLSAIIKDFKGKSPDRKSKAKEEGGAPPPSPLQT